MSRVPTLLIVAAVSSVATGCGGLNWGDSPVTHASSATRIIHLKPGHYTFHLGGRVKAGDKIDCVTRSGATAGGGIVPQLGHGVSSSDGFSAFVFSSGKVKVTCPANPGNA